MPRDELSAEEQEMKLDWRTIREDLLPFACCKHCRCRGFFKIGHPAQCPACKEETTNV